ncbi:CRISPR-associated protein Cas4 [Alicyclobacillus vulcanalis]|uniref:CRISPR-associated protein Cas4 n=1 Tax=Alicyclobacillus vulcanalis TaxID=252246 RepID=UPI0022867E55|nr:CRISPR-associated protein Cas4 [Alicyclobacillus vulcanalis]
MRVWSERLGIVGRCDAVEFHGSTPYPIEFKHGKSRRSRSQEIQLCAQALCLEDMFETPVPEGAIFHIHSHRRSRVSIEQTLRDETQRLIERVRAMFMAQDVPPPVADRRCERCSLQPACLPTWSKQPLHTAFWRLVAIDVEGEESCRPSC